jgi:hypothetical protein
MKYRIGRNDFPSKHLAGSVDELQEAVHNDLVGFCGHSGISSIFAFL